MSLTETVTNLIDTVPLVKDASVSGNMAVLRSLLGPAWRGMVERRAKGAAHTAMPVGYQASFTWDYLRDRPALARLYEAAKTSQWNGQTDLDWKRDVDPFSDELKLVPTSFLPTSKLESFQKLPARLQAEKRRSLTSWLLSQFLHGEQGALFAACPQDMDWARERFQREPPQPALPHLGEITAPTLLIAGEADHPDVLAHVGAIVAWDAILWRYGPWDHAAMSGTGLALTAGVGLAALGASIALARRIGLPSTGLEGACRIPSSGNTTASTVCRPATKRSAG